MVLYKYRSFRPLIGVSFCKRDECIATHKAIIVSVPLSGLVSVNLCSRFLYGCKRKVSVPLSGLVSVNMNGIGEIISGIVDGFRPLIGVSFCKLRQEKLKR